jgi:hypothetical protein
MRVLLDYFHSSFPIPQKFKTLAYYSIKHFITILLIIRKLFCGMTGVISILWKSLKSNLKKKFMRCFGVGSG